MNTSFTALLSLQVPIMQAPVGAAAGPELAASVSNAGALGSLPIWFLPLKNVPSMVTATMQLTCRPFSVNVRADLNQQPHVNAAVQSGASLVHLFWGDPTPYTAAIHDAGAKVIVTVASVDEAKQALDADADILIAQGWEAGGHVRGNVTTMALVPNVVDIAGSVPVLAAGGIVDGRGLAAALMLGASGAAMGTRFVASEESRAHTEYKAALLAARQSEAVYLADLFGIGWENAPHRALRNSTVRAWEAAGCPASGSRPNEKEIVAIRGDGKPIERYSVVLPMAGASGNMEALAQYAGQGVEGIKEILPASRIVETTVYEASACLSKFRS
ncbi:NAD(P)H-dependent flavin oxidoreductase [Herbaspirillum sp. GCM10030257]|uniref:NAD(P)H-dependent flavin oxidoreductase n=1 Tax=Herbaspirillum sp. GCM10030257 TaxID=3273393 RepID=UPI003606BBFF